MEKVRFINFDIMLYDYKLFTSTIDYEIMYEELNDNTKQKLFSISQFYYNTIKNHIDSSIDDDEIFAISIPHFKCSDLPISAHLSIANMGSELRINVSFTLLVKHHNNDSLELLQSISIIDGLIINNDDILNHIYMMMFYLHIVSKYFRYHPLLKYLSHKDEIEELVKITRQHIDIFGEYNECSICLEPCINKTNCGHTICLKCLVKVSICPLCRVSL